MSKTAGGTATEDQLVIILISGIIYFDVFNKDGIDKARQFKQIERINIFGK